MFISRREARHIANNLTSDEIRQYNNNSQLHDWTWKDGLSSYIEAVYTSKATDFSAIATDFNSNINRTFRTESGNVIDFCEVLDNYLSFMCYPENSGKRYTLKEFNSLPKILQGTASKEKSISRAVIALQSVYQWKNLWRL